MSAERSSKIYLWQVPKGGGAPHLCQPNIPHPLHSLAPRTIMGPTEWNKARTACYEACDRHCEVCGVECPSGRMDAHELYSFNYHTKTAIFVRLIGLCKTCHSFIHSGRAITCYKQHLPLWTTQVMLDTAEHGFNLVSEWNRRHPDNPPYRCYQTFLDWLKEPSLAEPLQKMIDQYGIEFYYTPKTDKKSDWMQWKLLYNDTEYYSPYRSQAEWQREMDKKNQQDLANNKNLFEGDVFDELRRNLAEAKKGEPMNS